MLKGVPEGTMKVFLGTLVIVFNLYNLANRYLKIIDLRRVSRGSLLACLFGFVGWGSRCSL